MRYKIIKQLKNSKMCLVCGTENPFGFNARFYQTDSEEIIGVFRAGDVHQGFPQRVHGGMIASILDEIIGEESLKRINEAIQDAIEKGIILSTDTLNDEVDKRIDKTNKTIYC